MKTKIIKGIIVGILIPAVFMGILYLVFYFGKRDMTEEVWSSGFLFGFGLNALFTWILFKQGKDYFGRGIMISTFIFFIFWVIKYVL